MSLSNPNISTSISVAIGFLFLLILPFEQILEPLGLNQFKSEYLGDTLKNLVIIGFGFFLINHFRYTRVTGLKKFKTQNTFLIIIPVYFILAGPLQYFLLDYQFQAISVVNVLILFISMMTVGLSEEIIFRGFILPHLIKGTHPAQSLVAPIFLSAAFFGVMHLFNLFQSDTYLITVLSQVIYATLFGVGFGIILLRTGSIYPIGFLHGIINFSSNWDDLPGAVEPANLSNFRTAEAIISVLIVLPFFIYMLRQIQKIDRKELFNLYRH